MTRTEEDGLHMHVCGGCFGTWLSPSMLLRRAKLDVAAEQARRAAPAETTPPPSPTPLADAATSGATPPPPALADLASIVAEANSKQTLRCPGCQKPMAKDRFRQMIPITIDRCKACDRIWLDTGEYNLIRRLYVELILSTDPQIVELRDKIAATESAWQGRPTLTDTVGRSARSAYSLAGGLEVSLEMLFNLLT
jgi:Zn-finger nucleic acid-binding protein